jgi:3-deoxy-D-manno-octulosonic-acid transferase
MSPWRILYSLSLYALTPLALIRLWWRGRKQPEYRRHIAERFGYYAIRPEQPVLWLHSVSVGETRAAEPLVEALRERWPDHAILLTHMTPTGRQTSEQVFGDKVARCYLPYDLPGAVARFLAHFQPRLGVLLETEIWPNLIRACRARSVPLYLVNARMSERSARGYARFGSFSAEMLAELAGIAAQTRADADRLSALGGTNVIICGNLKFDRSPRPQDIELGKRFRAMLGAKRVFLAASTREGEEEPVLAALQRLAAHELLTVIVPRHPQRFDSVARLLEQRGIAYQRRSSEQALQPATQVWLGDSLGEMYAYYVACDIAFVGGSLVALGGQNLLEACALGKPVLIGPHTYNFAEATELALDAGAALRVQDPQDLGRTVEALLGDAARCARMGEAGLNLMRPHQGAAQRIAAMLRPAAIKIQGAETGRAA